MAFPVLLWFATLALSFLVAVLRPKPDDQARARGSFGGLRFPTTEEGSPVPMVFGRVRLRAPNTIWYGLIEADGFITQTGPNDTVQAAGVRYFAAFQLGLCTGSPFADTAGKLYRIWVGERVWYSNALGLAHDDDGAEVTVNNLSFFGGDGEGGTFAGTFEWFGGSFTQNRSPYLSTVERFDVDTNSNLRVVPDDELPAYRGLCHVVFQRTNLGESGSVQPLHFEVEIMPDGLGRGAVGSDGDANPAEVIYELIRGDWGRADIPSSFVDISSFQAAADTLESEGHGIAMQVATSVTAWEAIQQVLLQIDGLLYVEPSTQRITMALIRDDYTAGSLAVYDEDDIEEVLDFVSAQLEPTANQVRVTYTNRDDDYTERVALVQDETRITEQGRVISADYAFPGITSASLANRVATRELQALTRPLVQLRVLASRRAASLRPGDVIKVSWSDYELDELIMRVRGFDLGTLEDGSVTVDLIEDKFAVDFTVFGDSTPGFDPTPAPLGDAQPTDNERVFELPRWYVLQGYNAGLFDDPNDAILSYVVEAPSVTHTTFDAQYSEDGGASFATDRTFRYFTPIGTLVADYDIDTDEVDGTVGIQLSGVSNLLALFAAASESQIANQGRNVILIGDELLAFESFAINGAGTIVTLSGLWRGILDTSPRSHTAGADVWLYFNTGLNTAGERVWINTEQDLQARFPTSTVWSNLPAASANVLTDIDIVDRAERPYPPDQLTIEGRSGHGAAYYFTTNFLETSPDLALAWRARNRWAATITKPTAASETLVDDTGDVNPTRYILRYQADGGGYSEQTEAGLTATLASVDEGSTIDLEVYAERNADPDRRSLYPVLRTFDVVCVNRLDTLPGLTLIGAWGLRAMVDGYAGNLVRIRDTDDDSETDYDANEFGRLRQVTTVGEARVVTIYDQSGNGNHLTAPSAAAQPLLEQVLNGSQYDSVADFDGTDDVLQTSAFNSTSGNVLLLSDVVGMWAGTWDGVVANAGGMWALDGDDLTTRYGVGPQGGDIQLYHNGSEDGTSYIDPNNVNDELGYIASIGTNGRTLWQETATGAQVSTTDSTTITYSGGVDYRLRLGLRIGDGYLAHGFHELAIFSGATALTADQRDAVLVDLYNGWWR